jgi:hypothetical protein
MWYFLSMFETLFILVLLALVFVGAAYFRLKGKVAKGEDLEKKIFDQKISELISTKDLLMRERDAIYDKEREKFAEEIALRDKIWSKHEDDVVSALADMCRREDLLLDFYTNNNLPRDFSGSFKPDFVLNFDGQYLIFDAKSSRSSNLESYLSEQVKKTAKKINQLDNIFFKEVYFVVPDIALDEIKRFSHYEEGLNFFIINKSAVLPVLFLYKKILGYTLASELSFEDKEVITTLLSDYYQSLNFSSAAQSMLANIGRQQLEKINVLPDEYLDDVKAKSRKSRVLNLNLADIKKIMTNKNL